MFRITEDPSSGSLVQCLAKNYKNGSIVSVDVDKVGVMVAYLPVVRVCSSLYMNALPYCRAPSAPYTRPTQTTIHPKTRCRKPYAATQHLILLMMGVCTRNMSS
jgi:hypothetical protein